MQIEPQKKVELKKACANCGAELLYAPGTTNLKCDYCNFSQEITLNQSNFEELELKPYLETLGKQKHSEEITMIQCKNCGANQHIEENYKSLHCVYCSSPLVIEDLKKEAWILPGALVPFQINQQKAYIIFQKWVKGLWWAPNNLKKASLDPQKTKGLYVPYWTFDAQLFATYSGQRGEYYYVTKTVGSGKNRRTVRERKTRWYPVSGDVSGFIDDTLIKASKQQSGIIPTKVARWDLSKLKPFNSGFLAGFVTEKYTIPLIEGHLASQKEARLIAERWARNDIGGDTQRVSSLNMKLTEETFKHILLPVYISSYHYNGKNYQFFVNGQSGVLSGKRPYSFWKIFFFILFLLLIFVLVYFFSN